MQHDALRVEELLHPQAIAARAGTRGVVEREQLRLERWHGEAADGAGVTAREHDLLGPGGLEKCKAREPSREAQCRLEGLGEALRGVGPDAHAIDDRLDGVLP